MSYLNGPRIVTDGLVLNLDAASVKSFDPVNTNVELLLHMDGANNSTTFTDSSKNGLTFTTYGNSKISTDQSKFSGSSAFFDGNGDYIECASSSGFAFGTGEFTVECWVNFSSLPAVNNHAGFFGTYVNLNSATNDCWFISALNLSGSVKLWLQRHGDGNIYAYSDWSPSLNTWYHIAAVRDSNQTIHLFINGIKQNVTSSNNWGSGNFTRSGPFGVGVIATPYYFHGYMDEVRIVKGKALYTSNFTPERKPYLDGNKIYDLSGNENNGTLVNGPTYSSDNYGVMSFDGTNDRIDCGTNYSSVITGTNSFSIECWVYPQNTQAQYADIWGNHTDNVTGIVCQQNSTNVNQYAWGWGNGVSWATSGGSGLFSLNALQWNYFVAIRNGTSILTYLNGYLINSVINSSSIAPNSAFNFQIGTGYNLNSSRYFKGNIANFRILNRALTANEVQQNYNALKGRYGLT